MKLLNNLTWITNDWGLIDKHDKFERQEAVYFRKTFSCKKPIKKANILATTNGIFNIYINGKQVSKEYLAPGPSEFTKALSYKEYDITEYLQQNNAILVIAGDGWYCGEYTQRERAEYVHGVKIALSLEIVYTDGETEFLSTDDSWQTFRGAIGLNDIYHGEDFDARKPHLEYSLFDYECKGENAKLTKPHVNNFTKYDIAPVRKISYITPTILKRSTLGALIYDFGQNFSGVIELEVKGESGQKIVMRHAEVMTTDGKDIYTQNLRVARATDSYILKGGKIEKYIPSLTYHGFRYAEISFDESKVELISIKGVVLHTDLKETGSFECDNELLNKIYSCALWGAKSNFVCIPTDCPQRNERFGWLADAQVFTQTAVNLYDCEKFYEFYLSLVEQAIELEKGNVPVFVPRVPKIGSMYAVFGWSDAVIIIPYVVYNYYGDKHIINRFVPLMKDYMEFCQRRNPSYIQEDMKYGDWLNAGQETERKLIATAYYAHSAKLLSYLLKEVGDSEWKKYDELFTNIKGAFRDKYFDPKTNRINKPSQTAYALGLCFDLLTVDECKDGLVEELAKYDNHVMCGFMGANLILPALCECGHTELATRLMLNDTYPSWGYCIKHGATTFWDRWDSYRADSNTYEEEEGMNSFNHYSFGSCVEWYFTYLLGITPLAPGFEKVKIKPYVPKINQLKKVSGHHDTKYGTISVNWEVKGDFAEITIQKPENMYAEFVFDNVVSIIQDGKERESFDGNSIKTFVKIKLG